MLFFYKKRLYLPSQIYTLNKILPMKKIEALKKKILGFSIYQIGIILVLLTSLFFFSDSSIIKRIKYEREIRDLKAQIEYYKKQTETDKKKLNELQSNKDNLEKYARENYLMKKENEEVFVIED